MAPFDSLRSLMAGHSLKKGIVVRARGCGSRASGESNALSKRNRASKGFSCPHLRQQIPPFWLNRRAFFFYILRCADGSLYVGYTAVLRARVKDHNESRGAPDATWPANYL